jgi:hypothetical protein
MGAESFQADGRTDTSKLIVASRNFSNAPKKLINECGIERLKVKVKGSDEVKEYDCIILNYWR